MKSPQSVKNLISALSTVYKRLSWDHSQFTSYHVSSALKALEVNSRYTPTPKAPVDPQQLELIIKEMFRLTTTHAIVAVLSFGFTGFLRQSNLLPHSAKAFDQSRHLTRGDVSLTCQGLQLKVKWSKTLQRAQDASVIAMPAINGRAFCPVAAYRHMLKEVPTLSLQQPLFTFADLSPLTLPYVNRLWRKAINNLGLDPSRLSLHSLQSGGTTSVWQSQLSNPVDIMRHGTWRSDSWMAYARPPPHTSTVMRALASLSD